jgi:hypothetical protein
VLGLRAFSKAGAYKVCPLCEELNRASVAECSVCGWRGRFVRDEEALQACLGRMGGLAGGRGPSVVRAARWVWSRLRRRFDCTV